MVKRREFDGVVIDKITKYIRMNDYSIMDVAKKAGYTYNQLYQILKKNQLIKLSDYVRICEALEVPFDEFL